ncbi:unnamed protein product [Sphagnum troendelagicum]|uniref:Peptidase A1 domain-containing protein n=1 Tax=Sphagnum troendelagicum TaxID=128251 RepID=A0ABP0TK16_9BRYO
MACNLRARSVLLVLEVVIILQACHSCMGLRQVLSAAQSLSHAGSSTLHNSWPESTRSPDDQSEVSTEDSSAVLKVLRTPLIHRDHPDSPLSKAYNTSSYSERLAAAMKRSLARRDYVSRRLMGSTFDGGFESQVIPDETYVQYGRLTEYTMALSIGTPPQRFFVLIDTGSDLLWLNCKPCNQCISHSFGSPFDPSLSSSYRNTSCTDNFCKVLIDHPRVAGVSCEDSQCKYFVAYGVGSDTTRGNVASETLTVTNIDGWSTSIPNVLFGCGRNQSNNSFFGADGILGLGRSPISLPGQLRNIYPEIFSYCLVPFSSSTTNTSTFFLGSPQGFKLHRHLVYTPIVNQTFSPHYYVGLRGISVNGTLLKNIPPDTFHINKTTYAGGVLLDSGGAFTFLNAVAYTAVSQELQRLITLPQVNQTLHNIFPLCFDLANASIHEFPTITFHFIDASGNGTVHFVLAPENYISLYLEPFLYCLTILPSAEFRLPVSIIGNLAQANHQMVFDQVNHQIGWAPADCSKL